MLMDVEQVAALLGVSEATIWRYHRGGIGFPKGFLLSRRARRWRRGEIEAYIEKLEARAEEAA